MNKPKLEDGYIKIANELIHQFKKTHLSGNEWKMLWVVLSKTYGWNKKEDQISLTQFQKETNTSRPNCKKAINKLVAKSLLVAKTSTFVTTYGFNKLYSEWTGSKIATSSKIDNVLVAKTSTKLVAKSLPTKDNKDILLLRSNYKLLLRSNTESEKKSYGNSDINEIIHYLKEQLQLPTLDGSTKKNRQYAKLVLNKHGTVENVKRLINIVSYDSFYRNNITSMMDLYYKGVKVVARKRGGKKYESKVGRA